MRLARDLEPGENESFFAKVAAVSENRCNNKFVETLMGKLGSSGQKKVDLETLGGEAAVVEKLSSVMAQAKVPLGEAFKEMVERDPRFLESVLDNLVSEGSANNMDAVDLLHSAVVSAAEDACHRQLDGLISQLEGDGDDMTDEDVASVLRQAIGLARFMGREAVAESLTEMLGDPVARGAIRGDPVTRGVLRKILVMRRLAGKDSRKKRKLEKLERFGRGRNIIEEEEEEDDSSLRRFVDQSEALTRGPVGSRLKKSKSVVKKSKSMIMTAKDIPMNAFMAMKNASSEKQDERWLQNFLSESVMEDVPWECSKALIILKEGFQVMYTYALKQDWKFHQKVPLAFSLALIALYR